MSLLEQIERIARPIVESKGAFLVDIAVRGQESTKVLEVFVDTDTGVTTDLCAEISREISTGLEATDLLQRRYHLVVSSPGLDRPLRFERQYQKNIGRRLSVRYRDEQHQTQRLDGELLSVSPENVVLRVDADDLRSIPFGSIIEAKVKTPW